MGIIKKNGITYAGGSGGGSGGSDNYNELANKPQINGKTLTGNTSFEDLGMAAYTTEEITNNVTEAYNKVFNKP